MKSYLSLIIFALSIFPIHATTTPAPSMAASSGLVADAAPSATTPVWGKLVLNGNTITCYYGRGTSKPTTWTQLGSPKTIGFLNNPLLVGLAITAHDKSAIASGTIDNFSISPTPTYRLQDGDVGAPAYMGSANLINGVWHLSGSGADIWSSSDQFNFQPWLVWGDCTVICRVTSISASNSLAKLGIMVRDGYNSGSDYALFCASNGGGDAFQYRPSSMSTPTVRRWPRSSPPRRR